MSNVYIKALREGKNIVFLIKEYDITMRRNITKAMHLDLTSAGILADEINRLAAE